MANISENSFGWMGSTLSCSQLDVGSFKDKIGTFFRVNENVLEPGNPTTVVDDPLMATWITLECGVSLYYYMAAGVSPFDSGDLISSAFDVNGGNVVGNHVVEFSVSDDPANASIMASGVFTMTSQFKNDYPVYKQTSTVSGGIAEFAWFDGSSYQLSSAVGNMSGAVANGSCVPNHNGYTNLVTNAAEYEVSSFTGSGSSANGIYCHTGNYNGKKVFTHTGSCSWFMYYDSSLSKWVLTDTRYNMTGIWIAGGDGDTPTGCFDAASGSGFDGAAGCATDAGTSPDSLATEDKLAVLAVESGLSVLVDEGHVG